MEHTFRTAAVKQTADYDKDIVVSMTASRPLKRKFYCPIRNLYV